ncbi:MAG: tRNA adenosine(34) deaminase TadA [Planctomycetaceae bacterium]|nr:tRNA adenosine(34) deaminase TadA [Planctomycetaceae bacterium]
MRLFFKIRLSLLFTMHDHQYFMRYAIAEAQAAAEEGEVPVGAIIVHNNQIIAAAHNQREQLKDPTAHAEMIAITQATESFNSWRLENCTIYVTLEPCPMCAGAILQARINTVVYGTNDPKSGAVNSLFNLLNDQRLNHRCNVVAGILAEQCGTILTEFFKTKR